MIFTQILREVFKIFANLIENIILNDPQRLRIIGIFRIYKTIMNNN